MARIVVSGATGFLGGETARHLRDAGHEVVALGRAPGGLAELSRAGIEAVALDLRWPVPEADVARISRADAFVHCAALSAPSGRRRDFHAANVIGTATALDLAARLGVSRFVNISSPAVYFAPRDQHDLRETQPLARPVNAYAATKAVAERLVLARRDLGPVNLRPRGIYGVGDTALLPRLLGAARRGPLPFMRQGRAASDLTHVSDVVRAIEAALNAGKDAQGETFNISGGEAIRVWDIVERVCRAAGVVPTRRKVAWRPLMAAARVGEVAHRLAARPGEPRLTAYAVGLFAFHQSLDISKAHARLGWRPLVAFDDGLVRTLEALS